MTDAELSVIARELTSRVNRGELTSDKVFEITDFLKEASNTVADGFQLLRMVERLREVEENDASGVSEKVWGDLRTIYDSCAPAQKRIRVYSVTACCLSMHAVVMCERLFAQLAEIQRRAGELLASRGATGEEGGVIDG